MQQTEATNAARPFDGPNGRGTTLRSLHLVVPMIWAAFTIYFFILLSQLVQGGFYLIDRGLGTVQVPDTWTVVSVQWDTLTFTGLGLAVLFVHTFFSDTRGPSGALALVLLLGLAVGLGGVLFSTPLFLWLVGLAFIGIFVQDSRKFAYGVGASSRSVIASTALWILFPITILSALATATWVFAGLGGPYPVQLGVSNFAAAELGLLGLSFPMISPVVLAFCFSWVLRPMVSFKIRLADRPHQKSESYPPAGFAPSGSGRGPLVLLASAVAIAIFVRVYAYLPAINPLSLRVGTDAIRGYACWLGLAPAGIPFNECVPYWWNLHIGTLWFLQGINALTNSADLTLKIAPAIWGILFDLATYVLVKEGTGDSLLAGVSALFSAVSLDTLVGIDAGILANWLALPVAFLFFAVILRMFRTRNKHHLILGFGLFAAMFLIHPWTWFLISLVFAGYLALEVLQGWRSRALRLMKLEAAILAGLLVAGTVALAAEGLLSPLAGLYVGYQTAIRSVNLSNVPYVLSNLQSSLIQWLGGGETDPIWYVLGIAGVLTLPSLRDRFAKLLIVWLAAIAVSLPLANASSLIQERVIFDIPLQIFAAIGVVRIARFLSQSLPADSPWHWRGHDLVLLVATLTVTLLALGFDLEYIGFLFRI